MAPCDCPSLGPLGSPFLDSPFLNGPFHSPSQSRFHKAPHSAAERAPYRS